MMEPDLFAAEEEEPLRVSPQPYTQLDRDVVSQAAFCLYSLSGPAGFISPVS